mmetsp:Transcript_2462/g.3690  ORF Transcript_2462/g.3690 Transcript_2462/m.3690 type:complete len:86 (+) Transcript_2462:314-571(+)
MSHRSCHNLHLIFSCPSTHSNNERVYLEGNASLNFWSIISAWSGYLSFIASLYLVGSKELRQGSITSLNHSRLSISSSTSFAISG